MLINEIRRQIGQGTAFDLNQVVWLLSNGADPNTAIDYSMGLGRSTALYLAAACDSPDLITLLVLHGAKDNTPPGDRTPLHVLCYRSGTFGIDSNITMASIMALMPTGVNAQAVSEGKTAYDELVTTCDELREMVKEIVTRAPDYSTADTNLQD